MPDRAIDVIVLGAGMVGVSAALNLQSRGLDVALVDRRVHAGQETSYGNAGLIEAATVFPHMFPRDPRKLPSYALAPEAYFHLHHGLTLGPVSGRLLADLVTGASPFTNPSLYRAERFA